MNKEDKRRLISEIKEEYSEIHKNINTNGIKFKKAYDRFLELYNSELLTNNNRGKINQGLNLYGNGLEGIKYLEALHQEHFINTIKFQKQPWASPIEILTAYNNCYNERDREAVYSALAVDTKMYMDSFQGMAVGIEEQNIRQLAERVLNDEKVKDIIKKYEEEQQLKESKKNDFDLSEEPSKVPTTREEAIIQAQDLASKLKFQQDYFESEHFNGIKFEMIYQQFKQLYESELLTDKDRVKINGTLNIESYMGKKFIGTKQLDDMHEEQIVKPIENEGRYQGKIQSWAFPVNIIEEFDEYNEDKRRAFYKVIAMNPSYYVECFKNISNNPDVKPEIRDKMERVLKDKYISVLVQNQEQVDKFCTGQMSVLDLPNAVFKNKKMLEDVINRMTNIYTEKFEKKLEFMPDKKDELKAELDSKIEYTMRVIANKTMMLEDTTSKNQEMGIYGV